IAGTEWRRQNDDVLYDRRADSAPGWPDSARWRGHHQAANVRAGAPRHWLSFTGAFDISKAIGRGQHSGDPRDPATLRRGKVGAIGEAARRAEHQEAAQEQGIRPVRG